MSRPARPHPARILTAILILSLPTGLLGRTGLPAFLTIPSSLILLTVPLWFSLHRDTDADSVLPSVARAGIILIGFHITFFLIPLIYVRFYGGSWRLALTLSVISESILIALFDTIIRIVWQKPLLLPFLYPFDWDRWLPWLAPFFG